MTEIPYWPPVNRSHAERTENAMRCECERREREVVAVEAEERDADHGGEHCRDDGRGEHGEHRRDAGTGVDEARVRVDADGEDRRRVRADEEERPLSERDLPGVSHEERETDRHERVQAHAVVQRHVERRELVRKPAGEDGSGEDQPDPDRCRPRHAGALDRSVRLVRRARDLRPRAPADEDEHDDQGDGQAVLRIDVADHELLEDPERIAAEQREADRAESAEHGRGEAVDGDRDVRAVRHRVARRKQRAAERAESACAGKRDDRERADVEADELGGAPRVRARDERLSDDRPAEEERSARRRKGARRLR